MGYNADQILHFKNNVLFAHEIENICAIKNEHQILQGFFVITSINLKLNKNCNK